jgi:DNA repair ATPase RecN
MSANTKVNTGQSPRLIPATRRATDETRSRSNQLLKKIGLTQEPGPEQNDAHRLWTALRHLHSQLVETQQSASQNKAILTTLQAQMTQVTSENQFLKQTSLRRQEDFQSLKKVETLLTQKSEEKLKTIQDLEEKNYKLENFIKRAQNAIQERFIWLKDYQEKLKNYANSINQEKTNLKNLTQQIESNLKKTQDSHPFHAQLQQIMEEIRLTSSQIQALPDQSKKRSALEIRLQNLEDRKSTLLFALEISAETLRKTAQEISQLVQNTNLMPIPPSPPQTQK